MAEVGKYFQIITLLALMVLAPLAQAVTVYYQPTPYPLWKYGSTSASPKPMPQDLSIMHVHDGWINSYYSSIMTFQSSQYKDFVTDQYADQKRPVWQFDFTPTLQLKMPLPGNYRWLLTNEIGGYECMGKTPWPDTAHQNTNYFSIDIAWNNAYTGSGTAVSYGELNTPVLAAVGGKVVFAGGTNGNTAGNSDPNGFYIVIDHDGDGNLNTGFSTRYLHLKQAPAKKNGAPLVAGNLVSQGDQIGIMGTTGWYLDTVANTYKPSSTGVHLHFGVRYNNNGSSTGLELAKVIMEGMILKSYQTECLLDGNGVPANWIRYYSSTNLLTGN